MTFEQFTTLKAHGEAIEALLNRVDNDPAHDFSEDIVIALEDLNESIHDEVELYETHAQMLAYTYGHTPESLNWEDVLETWDSLSADSRTNYLKKACATLQVLRAAILAVDVIGHTDD